jgi:hypothetical protein
MSATPPTDKPVESRTEDMIYADEKGEAVLGKDGQTPLYSTRQADNVVWTLEEEKKLKVR